MALGLAILEKRFFKGPDGLYNAFLTIKEVEYEV